MISSAFRLRRYRVLAFFVVVAILLFYNSSSISKTKNWSPPSDGWKSSHPPKSDAAKPKPAKADPEDVEIFRPPGRASFEDHAADHTSSGDKTVGNVPGGGGIHFVVDDEDSENKPVQRPPPEEDGYYRHDSDSDSWVLSEKPKPKKKPEATGDGADADYSRPGGEQPPKAPPAPVADSAISTDGKGQGRFEDTQPGGYANVAHWKKTPEHYPVPKESIISLPTGTPKRLPKVQFDFGPESEKDRKERHRRQGAVKDSFRHAWEGYRLHAWGHDEVSPVTKSYRDPFAGWAATLVDALDTMAIMGLHTQLTEALSHLEKIDFTTTTRPDIPMFETTIRYLGGLVGAYDVTGHKHPILLRKAVELADVLYNAFDTPNRMPVLYFNWRPSDVEQKKRAGSRIVMSELGSLSVEFTRLAQITGNNSYFDAIQRISDAFAESQMKTSMPGLWPQLMDASGCKEVQETVTVSTRLVAATAATKPYRSPKEFPDADGKLPELPIPPAATAQPERKPLKAGDGGAGGVSDEERVLNPDSSLNKRAAVKEESDHDLAGNALKQLSEKASQDATNLLPAAAAPAPAAPAAAPPPAKMVPEYVLDIKTVCKPQGLVAPDWGMDKYSLGGQADSTYEYLVKEYVLLGGLRPEYQTMYENSFKAFKQKLFFKPLAPKNPDILVSGQVSVNALSQPSTERFIPEGSHLTCFVGGMVALGAKIFKHPEQLEDAARLTQGCVWNYFSTATGIMPETFEMHHCKGKEPCKWDENDWLAGISPPQDAAIAAAKARGITLTNPWSANAKRDLSSLEKRNPTPEPRQHSQWQEDTNVAGNVHRKKKNRPVTEEEYEYDDQPMVAKERHSFAEDSQDYEEPTRQRKKKKKPGNTEHGLPRHSAEEEEYHGSQTSKSRYADQEEEHEEVRMKQENDAYDEWLIQAKEVVGNMRLPPGYTSLRDTRYILRPEAIESVFYMYRITGDKEWQEKGWRMWEAVEKYTKTHTAHSAINDVTSQEPYQLDEMESFWLAETLKYYYLLFAEPNVISLDEWVLNTEAHPLKRPQPSASTD